MFFSNRLNVHKIPYNLHDKSDYYTVLCYTFHFLTKILIIVCEKSCTYIYIDASI